MSMQAVTTFGHQPYPFMDTLRCLLSRLPGGSDKETQKMDANLIVPIIVALVMSIPGMYALFIGRNKTGIDASASAASALKSYSDEVVKLREELGKEREYREALESEREVQMIALEKKYKAKLTETEKRFQDQIDDLKARLDKAEERAEQADRRAEQAEIRRQDEANYSMRLVYLLKSHDIIPPTRPGQAGE